MQPVQIVYLEGVQALVENRRHLRIASSKNDGRNSYWIALSSRSKHDSMVGAVRSDTAIPVVVSAGEYVDRTCCKCKLHITV